MRAVLIASGQTDALAALTAYRPVPMLPLVDRPWVQHGVEYLIEQGITHIDLVLSHLPEQIERHLGDGRRWGCVIRYHLAREPRAAYRTLKAMDPADGGGAILLGHADVLAPIGLAGLEARPSSAGPHLWDTARGEPGVRTDTARGEPAEHGEPRAAQGAAPGRGAAAGDWTGWAVVPAGLIAEIAQADDRAAVEAHLRAAPGATSSLVASALEATNYASLLAAQFDVLAGRFPGLSLGARENDPGVWISRNVSLHPSARVWPPVFIGPDTQIGPEVQLGPEAVIGHGCVVERGSTLRQALVFPRSYIGRGLEVQSGIIDKNTLVNARLGEAITVREDFILGSLERGTPTSWLRSAVSRFAGLVLLIPSSPVLLATAGVLKIRHRGHALYRPEVVRLPAGPSPAEWRTVRLFSFAPPQADTDAPDATGAPSTDPGAFATEPGAPAMGPGALAARPGAIAVGPGALAARPGAIAVPPLDGPSDLLLRFLPGLLSVAAGHARLAGLPARTRSQIEALPSDWRELYRGGAIGLVSEEQVRFGATGEAEERYAAEAFSAAASGLRHDFGLLWGYLTRSLWRRPSA